MIVSRAPMRITLGGGGTDLPAYYRRFGGQLVTAAIDKHVYVMASNRFADDYHISYMRTEIAKEYDAIQHTRFREALRYVGVPPGIDLFSAADLPSRSGMGSSGSFMVAALQALYAHVGQSCPVAQLAETASHIEMDVLREPSGKQDPYAAALGGINVLEIGEDGTVSFRPVDISPATRMLLEANVLLFYSGIQRDASDALGPQQQKLAESDADATSRMHNIKRLGEVALQGLESGHPDVFGETLHEHWKAKRGVHGGMSDPFVDEAYDEAMKAGAIGGKLVGAGGGGFLLFYCPGTQARVAQRMQEMKLELLPFRFEDTGATIAAQI